MSLSRRKAERAFTSEGQGPLSPHGDSPWLNALEAQRAARSAYLNNNAQVTAKNRRNRGSRKPRYLTDSEWQDHARNALAKGGKMRRPGLMEWDASGRCENPVRITLYGINHSHNKKHWYLGYQANERSSDYPTRYLDIDAPCRKCRTCLRRRQQHWRLRMQTEIKTTEMTTQRTWFGTLTLNPHNRALVQSACDVRIGHQAWAELSPDEKYRQLAGECGKLITLWLKRVRANNSVKLRYCLVGEAHADGFPHFHILVHETGKPVTYRGLSTPWTYGFSNFKLVTSPSMAGYVAKYLAKDARTRVRASAGYGLDRQPPPQGKASEATRGT